MQQHLYRGWGPVFGPIEIAALVTSLWLCFRPSSDGLRPGYVIASACYVLMIAAFFALNDPVNRAVNHWTATTLAPDWAGYRMRWETGHALAAVCAVVAFVALLRQRFRDVQLQR